MRQSWNIHFCSRGNGIGTRRFVPPFCRGILTEECPDVDEDFSFSLSLSPSPSASRSRCHCLSLRSLSRCLSLRSQSRCLYLSLRLSLPLSWELRLRFGGKILGTILIYIIPVPGTYVCCRKRVSMFLTACLPPYPRAAPIRTVRPIHKPLAAPCLSQRNFVMLMLYWQTLRMKYMLNITTGRGYTQVCIDGIYIIPGIL